MHKRFLFAGLILTALILAAAGLMRVSANPFWSPAPPPTRTPGGAGPERSLPPMPLGSLPTQAAKSLEEETAVAQLQQRPLPSDRQGFEIPTRMGQPPEQNVHEYVDTNFGFSLSYPANWQLDSPSPKVYNGIPELGYLVTIRNFNNVVVKRDLDPQEIKIDLWLFPKPVDYTTLEAWIAGRSLFTPETVYGPLDRSTLGGKQIITWTATGPTVPEGARLYAFEQPGRIFLLVAYPSGSPYVPMVGRIVESIK